MIVFLIKIIYLLKLAQKFGFFVKLMKNKIRDLFEASSETLLKKFTERERETNIC